MTITNSAQEIFEDARQLYRAAIERLEAGDVRDAAEKAWCATLRATNALIVSQGGHEPERSPQTSRELDRLAENDQKIKSLIGRYTHPQSRLHGDCFYVGLCQEPATERRIRETDLYIQDAEELQSSSGQFPKSIPTTLQ